MSDEMSMSLDEVMALAVKLDGLEVLDDEERAVLGGVFALAGQAAASLQDPEVELFGMPNGGQRGIIIINGYDRGITDGTSLPGGIAQKSFSWGISQGGA